MVSSTYVSTITRAWLLKLLWAMTRTCCSENVENCGIWIEWNNTKLRFVLSFLSFILGVSDGTLHMLSRHMFCNPQLQQTFAELAEIIQLGRNQYRLFFPLPKSALLQLNESGGCRKPGAAASRAQPAACRAVRCQLSHLLCSQTSLFWCEIRLGVRT